MMFIFIVALIANFVNSFESYSMLKIFKSITHKTSQFQLNNYKTLNSTFFQVNSNQSFYSLKKDLLKMLILHQSCLILDTLLMVMTFSLEIP